METDRVNTTGTKLWRRTGLIQLAQNCGEKYEIFRKWFTKVNTVHIQVCFTLARIVSLSFPNAGCQNTSELTESIWQILMFWTVITWKSAMQEVLLKSYGTLVSSLQTLTWGVDAQTIHETVESSDNYLRIQSERSLLKKSERKPSF